MVLLKSVHRKYRLTLWPQWALILEHEWVMLTAIGRHSTVIGNDSLQHLVKRILYEEFHAGVSEGCGVASMQDMTQDVSCSTMSCGRALRGSAEVLRLPSE